MTLTTIYIYTSIDTTSPNNWDNGGIMPV